MTLPNVFQDARFRPISRYLSDTNIPSDASNLISSWKFNESGTDLVGSCDLTASSTQNWNWTEECGLIGYKTCNLVPLRNTNPTDHKGHHGALTVELQMVPGTLAWKGFSLFLLGDPTQTGAEAENYLCQLYIINTGFLRYRHQHGANVVDSANFYHGELYPAGELKYLAFTRDSAGTGLKLYLNGKLVDSASVSSAPSGGDGAGVMLQFLCTTGGGAGGAVSMFISSARIWQSELTSEQIYYSWQQMRDLK